VSDFLQFFKKFFYGFPTLFVFSHKKKRSSIFTACQRHDSYSFVGKLLILFKEKTGVGKHCVLILYACSKQTLLLNGIDKIINQLVVMIRL
jgi:hypothetical protein